MERQAEMNAPQLSPGTSFTRNHARAGLIAGAGAAIMLISLASALLPLADGFSGARVIGTMMVAAGLIEMIAGALRLSNRFAAILPGAITLAAGLLFMDGPFNAFVPTVRLVSIWLAARGAVLALTRFQARGSVRLWTLAAAATDLTLSALLFIGLSATTITITFFGPTHEIVSSFAWVLALSFVATGSLLIEVASSERTTEGLASTHLQTG